MKILLTGATGYIGKRLLLTLLSNGHTVVCCVRDKQRFISPSSLASRVEIIEVDFLDRNSLNVIPKDIDGAYYLMHSMSSSKDYEQLENLCAQNFRDALNNTNVEHIIYLSGIVNEDSLSKHLKSRKVVENELAKGNYHLTTIRAGIIIGSGSASFEIIRDLVEKLPFMVFPKWLNTRSQPVAIKDVISFLHLSLLNKDTYDESFDIGGPDIISYRHLLIAYSDARGLKRRYINIPFGSPVLSSYWLYFITSTSFKLAKALVSSVGVEVVCKNDNLNKILDHYPMSYEEALKRTLLIIEGQHIVSSWKDSMVSGRKNFKISEFLTVPSHGCYVYTKSRKIFNKEESIDRIWKIGGKNGWFFANWLWHIRGFMDRLIGGVGLNRGRTNDNELHAGDAIDFWRVLYADRNEGWLLLFAEMKVPGEAWLEFKIKDGELHQTATFRPKGIWGRAYWFAVYPFHNFVFNGMLKRIVEK